MFSCAAEAMVVMAIAMEEQCWMRISRAHRSPLHKAQAVHLPERSQKFGFGRIRKGCANGSKV